MKHSYIVLLLLASLPACLAMGAEDAEVYQEEEVQSWAEEPDWVALERHSLECFGEAHDEYTGEGYAIERFVADCDYVPPESRWQKL